MHENAALITRFYEAFAAGDGETMAACYAPDAVFHDPVFTDLRGAHVAGMWKMLTEQGKDLVIRFSDIHADNDTGHAHWEADYTFSVTGKTVNNVIDAEFTFRDGLIATHIDTFHLYRWTRMALGMPGVLLGWTPLVQNRIRRTASKQLDRYMAKHSS